MRGRQAVKMLARRVDSRAYPFDSTSNPDGSQREEIGK